MSVIPKLLFLETRIVYHITYPRGGEKNEPSPILFSEIGTIDSMTHCVDLPSEWKGLKSTTPPDGGGGGSRTRVRNGINQTSTRVAGH